MARHKPKTMGLNPGNTARRHLPLPNQASVDKLFVDLKIVHVLEYELNEKFLEPKRVLSIEDLSLIHI